MVALWLACTSPVEPGETGEVAGDSAFVDSASVNLGVLEPEWDIHGASEAFSTVLARGLPGPDQVRGPYLDLLAEGDEGCPNAWDLQFPEGRVPLVGCTSQQGAFFLGMSRYEEDGEGFLLWGDLRMVRADGRALQISGQQVLDGNRLMLAGSFVDEAGTNWTRDGVGANLDVAQRGEERYVRGGLGSQRGNVVGWYELALTETCATGALRTRDTRGGWYVLTLDDCRCGVVTFSGRELGSTCVSFDALREVAFP